MAVIETDIKYIKSEVSETKEIVQNHIKFINDNYVPKSEFLPVRNAMYALIGLLCTGVIVAILKMVL